jgi:hypothetical protein
VIPLPCPFHALTGLLCPLCGSTRALAALLRGDLLLALRCNMLTVAAVLWAAGFAVRLWWRGSGSPVRDSLKQDLTPGTRYALALLTLLFTVARNLPWGWFWWLRPA